MDSYLWLALIIFAGWVTLVIIWLIERRNQAELDFVDWLEQQHPTPTTMTPAAGEPFAYGDGASILGNSQDSTMTPAAGEPFAYPDAVKLSSTMSKIPPRPNYEPWVLEVADKMGMGPESYAAVECQIWESCEYAIKYLNGSLAVADLHQAGDLKAVAANNDPRLGSKRFYEFMSQALREAGLAELRCQRAGVRLTEAGIKHFEWRP